MLYANGWFEPNQGYVFADAESGSIDNLRNICSHCFENGPSTDSCVINGFFLDCRWSDLNTLEFHVRDHVYVTMRGPNSFEYDLAELVDAKIVDSDFTITAAWL